MKNTRKSLGLGAAVIMLLTVAAYLPAFRCGFIWDDGILLVENPMVKAAGGFHRLWLPTELPHDPGSAVSYYPLISSLWWIEWRLWGNDPTGYHVVNVLLHAVNAVLVWLVLRRLTVPGAWVAGLVFAVHPVNVATVAWISEQKNTLSMLFSAVAILLYLRFDEGGRWRWYGLSLAAFLLAMLSKSAVVMLPVVLLGCVWWMRGRAGWKDLLRGAPFFGLSLVLGLLTMSIEHRALAERAIRADSFASHLVAAGWVPWFYLYKALLPFNLTVIYPRWQMDASRWISYVPGIALAGCFVLFLWKRRTWGRPLLFGLGYFVVMLFPVLGFFDQSFYQFTLVADHWQYYSIAGVIALMVAGGQRIGRRMGEQRRFLCAVAVLAALAMGTWKRACVYAGPETLWRDNVTKEPDVWFAHSYLGVTLGQVGKFDEAIHEFELALQMKPDFAEVHYNLGGIFKRQGRLDEAIGQYEQALQIKPDYAEAHNNLGVVLGQTGNLKEAIGHLEQAVRIKPNFAEAQNNLGVALELAGRVPEAIGHLEQAVRIKPDFVEAQNRLARLRALP